MTTATTLTTDLVWTALKTVIDPELQVDIVSLGLIYRVTLRAEDQPPQAGVPRLHIVMTLTTPGCPLASVFDSLVRDGLRGLPDIDVDEEVAIELTFDPPWTPDMMSAEAKAELGF